MAAYTDARLARRTALRPQVGRSAGTGTRLTWCRFARAARRDESVRHPVRPWTPASAPDGASGRPRTSDSPDCRAHNSILWPRTLPLDAQAHNVPLVHDTWGMDSYQGTATLEWWANRWTCLGKLRVRVAIRCAADTWTSDATLASPLTAEDQDAFDLLMRLDPHFTLRFDDTSTLLVKVAEAGDEGCLVLTEAEEAAAHPIA